MIRVGVAGEDVYLARACGRQGGGRSRLTEQQTSAAQQPRDAGRHTVTQTTATLGAPRFTIYGHLNMAMIGRSPERA